MFERLTVIIVEASETLRNGLDRQPLAVTTASSETPLLDHENIRGADYYH